MADFTISNLGEKQIRSPLAFSKVSGDFLADFVSDEAHILSDIEATAEHKGLLEKAGPREMLFFDPQKVYAAIVTCGGLCPGLNDVIRSIVMTLWYRYGVRKISGIRYGYRGLLKEFNLMPIELTPQKVAEIHLQGGTILGSSRGHGDRTADMIDAMEKMNINMLFTIGGDGTQKGALALFNEIQKRKRDIAIVGIPKTIDNDLSFVQRSFGFETAVAKAVDAIMAAHTEAHGAVNGIGLVKVMGRQSGFIAANAALASGDVNFLLVPEVPFDLEGDKGLLAHLENRMKRRSHAVILTAEGAGQKLLETTELTDASGNVRLEDIGLFLKTKIQAYFKQKQIEVNLKYIDPSYIIRSLPANPNDSIYCNQLGTNAVHAAMAGKTGCIVGLMHNQFVHVPLAMTVSKRNAIDPDGQLWRSVIDATGQPALMKN